MTEILKKCALPLLVVCAGMAIPSAQGPTGPTFEVASLKKNISDAAEFHLQDRPDGGYVGTNIRVSRLILTAYPEIASAADIRGLPDWAQNERYDFLAKSSIVGPTAKERSAMMRALLAERFHLGAHFDRQEQSAYDLVMSRSDGKLGVGMRPTEINCDAERARQEADRAAKKDAPSPPTLSKVAPRCKLRVVNELLEGDTTMPDLANALYMFAGRAVVDRTGLEGFYTVKMTFDPMAIRRGPDTGVPPPNAPPSIFSAMPEQLGLKLQSSKTTVVKLVVDRIEPLIPN